MNRSSAGPTRNFEPWLVGLLTAIVVATPFLPSEHVVRGGGVLLILATLVALLAWLVVLVRKGSVDIRIGATDVALAAMLGWHTLSVVVQGTQGQPRGSINVAWQWLAFGGVWFLTRQLIRSPAAIRAMVAVQLALAVGLSTFGFFQVAYVMPRDRAEFARDPDRVLREAGIVAPPGSPLRGQYENRLQSREPIATFALTNSLAGFLVPALILAAALTYGAVAARGTSDGRSRAGFILAGVLIAACLLLTKSRSAYVATAGGVAMLMAGALFSRRRIGWKLPLAVIVGMACLIVLGAQTGMLDIQVLSEARKSLGYRFEYWQATLRMMQDRPWFGCGPGNFQVVYAAYKLPQSSEMVADPHNFLLEICATAGLPAVLAFCLALALGTGQIMRRREGDSASSGVASSGSSANPRSPFADQTPRVITWGAAGGILLGFVAGTVGGMAPELSLVYTAVPAGALVLWLVSDWIRQGELAPAVVWIAVAALFVNLLAAGGIGFPAVAHGWWLLGALALNLVQAVGAGASTTRLPTPLPPAKSSAVQSPASPSAAANAPAARPLPAVPAWIAAGGLCVLIGLFYFTMYRPVISGRLELAAAARAVETGKLDEALERLAEATRLDPWSAEPWSQTAWVRQRIWLATRDPRALDAAVQASAVALSLDQSHVLRMDLGSLFLQSYRQTGNRPSLDMAGHLYAAATERYPNHAFGYAQWAWALELARKPEQSEASRAAARRAIELDDLMPHAEQQLRHRSLIDFPPDPTADGQLPSRPAGESAREYCESAARAADVQPVPRQ